MLHKIKQFDKYRKHWMQMVAIIINNNGNKVLV